eukprot:2235553-Rhodomonas_salina.4
MDACHRPLGPMHIARAHGEPKGVASNEGLGSNVRRTSAMVQLALWIAVIIAFACIRSSCPTLLSQQITAKRK